MQDKDGDDPFSALGSASAVEEASDAPPPSGPMDRVASVCMAAAGTMLVVLIFIFGWLVYGRYILNNTPTWVEQVSLLLVVWITFLGTAIGVWRGNHLSVGFIRESMPEPLRSVMRLLSDLLILAVGAAMIWQGWNLVEAGFGRAVPMLGISEAWRMAALPTCGVLIVLFMAFRIPQTLREFSRRDGEI